MGAVFIRYQSEDRAMIAPLAQALERAGHQVLWDKKIAAGGAWHDAIAGALDAAKVVVVAWSKRTEDSGSASRVLNGVDQAQRLGKPFIPVRLAVCVIPMGNQRLQAASLTGWTGNPSHREWQEVLAGVEGAPAGRRVAAAALGEVSGWARARAVIVQGRTLAGAGAYGPSACDHGRGISRLHVFPQRRAAGRHRDWRRAGNRACRGAGAGRSKTTCRRCGARRLAYRGDVRR
jgi:hypothetical protein